MIKAHYHPYAITRLLTVVTLLMSATFAADAERVDYQRAAKLPKSILRCVTTKALKHKRNNKSIAPAMHLIIYLMMHTDTAL